SWQVRVRPEQGEAEEQGRDARRDRADDIAGGERVRVALDQQSRVEREGGEGREPAEETRRQEQPHVLRDTGTKSEIAGERAHDERTEDIDDQRSEREAVTEHAHRRDIDTVPKRAPDAGAEKDDQIKHKPPTAADLRT